MPALTARAENACDAKTAAANTPSNERYTNKAITTLKLAKESESIMEISPAFEPLLNGHSLHNLDELPATILGAWPDLTIAFTNKAWEAFASRNGGEMSRWGLGACILDSIPAVLLPFYREHFATVLCGDQPWEHVYECSSPDVSRLFHMLVYPLSGGKGLLMIHSLRVESAHNRIASKQLNEYEAADGLFHQCAHCRRTQRADNANTWEWVPELVRRPRVNTSHGLCNPCYVFYYGETRRELPRPISTIGLDAGLEFNN